MIKVKYIIVLVIAISIIGCKPDITAELNATNSLTAVLNNVESTASEVDTRLIREYSKDIRQKCSKIQNEMTDTVNLEQAQSLVNFCALEQHLQSCIERKELIDEEVLRTRNQLYNLKTDLIEGRANKDSAKTYIEQEFLFVESLHEGTEQLITELNGCFKLYAELKPEIDRLIIDLPNATE